MSSIALMQSEKLGPNMSEENSQQVRAPVWLVTLIITLLVSIGGSLMTLVYYVGRGAESLSIIGETVKEQRAINQKTDDRFSNHEGRIKVLEAVDQDRQARPIRRR